MALRAGDTREVTAALGRARAGPRVVLIGVVLERITAQQHFQAQRPRIGRPRQGWTIYTGCLPDIRKHVPEVLVSQPCVHVPGHEVDQRPVALAPVTDERHQFTIVVSLAGLGDIGTHDTEPAGLLVAVRDPAEVGPVAAAATENRG